MSSNAERLAAAVKARRAELDLSQLEVGQNGGPSNTTLTEVENGRMETLTRTTARRLDAGLQWEKGSARRTWDGGDPIPLLPGVRPSSSAILRHYIVDAELDDDTRARLLEVLDERGAG